MATVREPSAVAAERARAPMPRRWTDAARRNAERMAFADAPRLIARHCRERAADFVAVAQRDPLQANIYRAGRRVWLMRARAARGEGVLRGAVRVHEERKQPE